ncbi:excisionase family DNA-binding protein [Streptomyces hydrogenans]
MNRTLTVAGAADALGVSTRTVERWLAAGTLRATRVGRSVRIDPESVAAVERPYRSPLIARKD